MAFRTDHDALVLGVLQLGSMHGYEITKRINQQGEKVFSMKEGQLYPILHRLENEGKIVSEWVQTQGKPAKRVYSIPENGERELIKQRESWKQFVSLVNQIMTPTNIEVNHG